MSRAGFLRMSGAAALAGAALLTSACSADAGTPDQSAGPRWDAEYDVAVVGSGCGGFTAALTCAQQGLNTVLIEISKTTGGGSSFCGGILYNSAGNTPESYDEWTEHLGSTELGHKYVTESQTWFHWIQDSGLTVVEPRMRTGYLQGVDNFMLAMGDEEGQYTYGCRAFFDSFEEVFAQNKGTLLLETRAEKILTDDEGKVIGLRCKDSSNKALRIAAKAVVIATGGFQGNEELRVRYLGPQADMATIHAVPYCTGNGLKMCEEVGASLAGAMSNFSATIAAAWPAKEFCTLPDDYEQRQYDDEGKYWLYSQHLDFQPANCIYVNVDGLRYEDEDAHIYRLPQATIKQKRSTGIMVMDGPTWDAWQKTPGNFGLPMTVKEQFEKIILPQDKVGGMVYSGDTLEELADKMDASGIATHMVNKENLLHTVAEYNAAIEAGKGPSLEVPRYGEHKPITTPPFYAYPTRPAIYATWGGVQINARSQVLDKNNQPITGLYCCAPTAGGIMREIYSGSIGAAGTTGMWAGNAIVKDITSL
ncbi:MAG: FAD-dependent oxidoreductase [Coriobacteriaceae bacterium]|nr:FAD-dependent oxidoreductase [Coriobacteriaceae bacterium]